MTYREWAPGAKVCSVCLDCRQFYFDYVYSEPFRIVHTRNYHTDHMSVPVCLNGLGLSPSKCIFKKKKKTVTIWQQDLFMHTFVFQVLPDW